MAEDVPGYTELKLRIERDEEGRYRVIAFGPDGATASESLSLPFGDTELDNFVLRVGRPRRGVRSYRSSQMEEAKRFGAQLFEALVAGEVRDVYRAAQGVAQADDSGLRVTLYLTDVPELMSVPWEFLYERPGFLAQSIFSPVVRSLDLKRARGPRRVTLPLRILGMVSRPQGFETLDVESEQQKLADALSPLRDQGLVMLEWLERATLSQLDAVIGRRDEVHVLHYVGHGAYDERTEGGILVLENEHGQPHEVTGEEIGSLLQDKRSLQLVVLNSCEGARGSHVDPFSGVASSLVEYGIPAVIGMQFEITDEAAVTFAGRLYGSLAQGYPVDAALAQARKAIFAAGNDIEFGTPVLFLRAADARLFDLTGPPKQVREEGDLALHLEQRPERAKSGEEIAWLLAIENTGDSPLRDLSARNAAGDQLAELDELEPGGRHTVRWSEPLDPELRHLITVVARDPRGSSMSKQIAATVSTVPEPQQQPPRKPEPPTGAPPKPASAGGRRRLVTLGVVLAVAAAVAIAVIALGGGGGESPSATGGGGGGGQQPADSVDGIALERFDEAKEFTAKVPAESKRGVVEEKQGGGTIYTALYTRDQKINVVIQRSPEVPPVPPSEAAARAAEKRADEGATEVKAPQHTTVAGRNAYLLTFQHRERARHGIPDMGQVDVANYFFNDSGSGWYTRAAVSTSLPDSEKVAEELATKLTSSFRPKS
jgi:hypothetical protein